MPSFFCLQTGGFVVEFAALSVSIDALEVLLMYSNELVFHICSLELQ